MKEDQAENFIQSIGLAHGDAVASRWGVLIWPWMASFLFAYVFIFSIVNQAETATTFGIALALCIGFTVLVTKFIPRKVTIIVGILITSTIIGLILYALLGWFWALLTIPILWFSFKAIPENCNSPDFYTLDEEEAAVVAATRKEEAMKPKVNNRLPRVKIQIMGPQRGRWDTFNQGRYGKQKILEEMKRAQRANPEHRVRAVDENGRFMDSL